VAICTGYEAAGEVHTEFPSDLTALDDMVPQYEWFEGWREPTGGARRLEDLPAAARRYLDRIEQLVEAPIRYVSVGTRRDQIIGS
jgi:adenylosuccinate synthase